MRYAAAMLGLLAVGFVYAEYKPNGPPLFVCSGAVPLEPNTDKLTQITVRNSAYERSESKVVIATNPKSVAEGLRLLGKQAGLKPDDFDTAAYIYCFYFSGAVAERQGAGLPTVMLPEVFGVEREYIPRRDVIYDMIVFHLVAKDVRPTAPMPAHSPAVVYKIAKTDLDTEHNGTPAITKQTRYRGVEHQVVIRYHNNPAK